MSRIREHGKDDRRGLRRPGGTALLAGVLLVFACAGKEKGGGRNLVLVTLDTTRADHLGSLGRRLARTPVLDRLARRGVVFRQALTAAPITLPSHASLLTGTYPAYHGARDNGSYVLADPPNRTLAEILAERGYATVAVISAFVLHSRFGLAQGFEIYDDDSAAMKQAGFRTTPERRATETTRAALERAAVVAKGGRPLFLWVHYFDPHAPFVGPEPYASLCPDPGRRGPTRGYDAEIAYVDAELGRLLRGLGDLGLLDGALVVVAGDHGEGLESPHEERTHGVFVYEETLRVPLLFRDFGGRLPARLLDGPVSLVDVMPTILEHLGIAPPPGMQGRSLLATIRSGRPGEPRAALSETLLPYHTFGWSPLFALRVGRWKFIRAPRPELYDLTQDPAEQHDLARVQVERARGMDARLTVALGTATRDVPAATTQLSPRDRERLLALGYMADGSPGPPAPPAPPPGGAEVAGKDPKDLIMVYRSMLDAAEAARHGKWSQAISLLRGALHTDPDNFRARLNLGDYLLEAGDPERALRAYLQARDLNPRDHDIHYRLGRAQRVLAERERARGNEKQARLREQAAEGALLRAVELFPSDVLSMTLLGKTLASEPERAADARAWFRRALALDPSNEAAREGLRSLGP